MAKSVESAGRTIEEALKSALTELQVSEERVIYEVLVRPEKGIFGFGRKDAKIRVTVKEQTPIECAEEFLKKIFAQMKLEVEILKENTEQGYLFSLMGKDLGILIGKHGQTLDSLQYLTNLAANRGVFDTDMRAKILLDAEHYRARREEALRALADRLAKKAYLTGRDVHLEPMSSQERRLIHMALQGNSRVISFSDGEDYNRHIVISPRRKRRNGERKEKPVEE